MGTRQFEALIGLSLGPPVVMLDAPPHPATGWPGVSCFPLLATVSWQVTPELLCCHLLSSPVVNIEIKKEKSRKLSKLGIFWFAEVLSPFLFCLISWLLFLILCSMHILSFHYLMLIVLICFPPSKYTGFVQAASAFREAGTLPHSLYSGKSSRLEISANILSFIAAAWV